MLFEFDTNIFDIKDSTEIYDLNEGFTKGNMFPNLYDPYKNYEPKTITPKNERELLLDKIYKLCFALNDLNLYLDVHSDDLGAYDLFKKYAEMYNKVVIDYESKYQVLELSHDIYGKYTWISNPWPWEDKYNV